MQERERIVADIEPALVVDDAGRLGSMLTNTPQRFRRGLPLARPMHVTSGTTGQPKVVLSPLHHSAPLRFAMGTVLAGRRIVVPGARLRAPPGCNSGLWTHRKRYAA